MADVAGPIEGTARLSGGISSEAFAVGTETKDQLVLRLHTNRERVGREPDIAGREAYSLQLAVSHGIPAPRLLAVDPSGEAAGVPAVLMTLLEGTAQLDRALTEHQTHRLAAVAAAIHEATGEGHPYEYRTYIDLDAATPPTWSENPDIWERALDLARLPAPDSPSVFVHRDFHPGNFLWMDDELTGVVDWVDSGRGPADVDAGHCRLNMVQLWDLEAADRFAAAYAQAHGRELDPHWDLISALEVLDSDEPWWDRPGMATRLDDYVGRLIATA